MRIDLFTHLTCSSSTSASDLVLASESVAVTRKFSDDVNVLLTASGCCITTADVCRLALEMTDEHSSTLLADTVTMAVVDMHLAFSAADDTMADQLSIPLSARDVTFDDNSLFNEVDVTNIRSALSVMTHETVFCMQTGTETLLVVTTSPATELTHPAADEAPSCATAAALELETGTTGTVDELEETVGTKLLVLDGTVV